MPSDSTRLAPLLGLFAALATTAALAGVFAARDLPVVRSWGSMSWDQRACHLRYTLRADPPAIGDGRCESLE